MRMRQARPGKGFTIIELVVVVALVAILASLATASFGFHFRSRQPEHYVDYLTHYLRYLQFKAIEDAATHRMSVDDDRQGVVTEREGEVGGQFMEVRHPFSRHLGTGHDFELEMSKGRYVYFYPNGSITPNQLELKRDGMRIALVTVQNRIGVVEVSYARQ
jgi:prepilin-type N-terminal cleavage/methylation domain-containing protein